MELIEKTNLSERDIRTKFITPALKWAGWDVVSQVFEKVSFTSGRIIVRSWVPRVRQAKPGEGGRKDASQR
jgi:type I restriction enzyme R subunit